MTRSWVLRSSLTAVGPLMSAGLRSTNTVPSIQQQESEEEQQHRETSLGSSGEKQEPGDSITLKNILQERCLHHTSESAHGDSAQDEHDR